MPNVQYVATKAIIKNARGQVLVLRQNDPTISGHGKCHPPGGIVEFGESLEESLDREVFEELGVHVADSVLIDVAEWGAERDDIKMQFVGLFYEAKIDGYEFTLQDEEVSEAVWVDADNFDSAGLMEPSKSIIGRSLDLQD